MVDLGLFARPSGVNDEGQVVGNLNSTFAFSWTPAGGMVNLGTFGGNLSTAEDVNEGGQVVGWSRTTGGVERAFSWTAAGGMVDLGTLGGTQSLAFAVNDKGQVVGRATPQGDAISHAFSWTAATGMIDLGTVGPFTHARDVNESGQVIGFGYTRCFSTPSECYGEPGTERAFSWTAAGGLIDLGTLGGSHSVAWDVNDRGRSSRQQRSRRRFDSRVRLDRDGWDGRSRDGEYI